MMNKQKDEIIAELELEVARLQKKLITNRDEHYRRMEQVLGQVEKEGE